MKKIIALMLCVITVLSLFVFTGCNGSEGDSANSTSSDKGAIIPVYLSTEISNFDPIYAYTDEAAVKILNMLYVGLTTIDENGKVQKSVASGWEYEADEDEGTYVLEVYLNSTRWSDGRNLTADDFVFAWKRILDPECSSPASAMLMNIKNARKAKLGDCSIDDIGVVSANTYTLRIEFEKDIDYKQFLENCASPALVALREDVVKRVENDWASSTTVMVSSGPFVVRTYEYGKTLILERNIYYYRNTAAEEKLTKYVVPYRLVADYDISGEEQLVAYNEGRVLFVGEIPLEYRESYKAHAEVSDTMVTSTYYFNTRNELFEDARVRNALSMAIDRNELVSRIVFAKAADGVVPAGVYNTSRKDSFREVGGNLISSTADVEGAKALLKEAGVKSGSFSITVRKNNEVDKAVAEYCKEVWEGLGFKVTIDTLGNRKYTANDYDLYEDKFQKAFAAGEFDVIAIDALAISTDAFATLAPFAKQFAGQAIDIVGKNYDAQPHITGYDSEEYNNLIEEAFNAEDRKTQAELLHQAEQVLIKDMPVMPLFVYQDAYVMSKELKKLDENYFGGFNFKPTTYKNYVPPVEE